MKLESVRDLKASLMKPAITFAGRPVAMAARAMAARPVEDVDPVQRAVALGVAPRGRNDFRLAVRVQSRAIETGGELDAIRARARGEVDVRYVGRVVKRAKNMRKRHRPLIAGSSIGHYAITAGTLGCFVETASGAVRILSNNHVLANENLGKAGDAIIQPGELDGGRRRTDTVGKLGRFVRLKKTGKNLVDCALASLADDIDFDASALDGIGRLAGVAADPVDIGDRVAKVGRTTGATRGRVTAFELDNLVVGFDLGNLRFDDQIEIEGAGTKAFSQGGDSGSIIVDGDRHAVALLFAGSDQGGRNGQGLTFANPIDTVLKALKVDLLT
jgi:hypothetical protein